MPNLRTPRLNGFPVSPSDLPEIQSVYAENCELLRLLDYDHDPAVLAERFVLRANLPTGGTADKLLNLVLKCGRTGNTVGLLGVYSGYPEPAVAYLGELFLRLAHQRLGLGREVCLALESDLRAKNMRTLRVGVGLRNWNALRFWIKLGYVRITGMSGDRYFTPDAHAYLELEKNL